MRHGSLHHPECFRHGFITVLVVALTACLAGCWQLPDSLDASIVIDTDNYDELLDRYTHSEAQAGCTMQILTESEQSYVGFREVLDNATSTIDIETLNFDDDTGYEEDISLEFAELLADKARAGVRVRVMLDSLTHAVLGRAGINNVLLDGGVDVREYRPDRAPLTGEYPYYRMHKKILVADGVKAIIGGSNFGYRYEGLEQWRDTNVVLSGPIVGTLQEEFIYDWDNRSGPAHLILAKPVMPPVTGPHTLREIDQKPSEDDFDLNSAIVIGLRLAQRRVDIEAPYFNPTDWMIREMGDAASRGVEVRVLMNSALSTDIPFVYWADANLFDEVLGSGVRLFLWERTTRTMHSKAMIVDDALAMIGTYNFNARSIAWDTENAIFSTDPTVIPLVDQMIQDDFGQENVIEIDLDWVNAQPLAEKLKWAALGWLGPLF